MGKTAAERKQAERERKAKAGLRRYEIWLHPNEWKKLKETIKKGRKAELK